MFYSCTRHKALEGILEGARLWFKHNKWALNKCGLTILTSELCEPNLYTIEGLSVIIAVFADDVGAGFKDSQRAQYLKIRAEYGKLINIDCTSPFTTLPIELFTGVNIKQDRNAGTLTISQEQYFGKMAKRFEGRFERRDMWLSQI